MNPLSVTIERFGSFVEKQTFNFPEKPGLYFMQGRNEAEPKLGSNGSDKSTLWKALTWCLFGKDPKGLRAGDVANWKTPKGARVAFDFVSSAGEVLRVTRTHAPNTWTLGSPDDPNDKPDDLTKDETNPIFDQLRLEYETWLQCVLMAQGEPYFLDLRNDAKASVFSELMGLDRWLRYSERASNEARTVDLQASAAATALQVTDGKLRQLDAQDVTAELDVWEQKRKANVEELTHLHEAAALKSHHLKQEMEKAGTAADFARSGIEGEQGRIDDAMAKVSKVTAAHQHAIEDMATVREQWRAASEELDTLAKADRCPLCGGTVDQEMRDEMASNEGRLLLAVDETKQKADLLAKDLRAANNRLQEAQGSAQKALQAADAAQRAWGNARNDYERQERLLDDIEEEAERVLNEANPFTELAAAAARDRRQLEGERAEWQERHSSAADRAALLGFWVRGFKDVRLQLVGEALDHFALEANSCAQALGLSGWELVFEVDREMKSGAVKAGFNVFVRSPHNDRQVPWEAWSGGESQRLRLAAQLGLSNLIRDATGAAVALEVWDEPTEGMSDRGIADLLDALADRARVEQRQIWVVDHRVLGYAGWDGGVTVVKDEKGSRFA